MDENIPNPDGSSERRIQFDAPPPMVIDPECNYVAEMVTTAGTMKIALNSKRAPVTVNNFVFLARWHYYDGIIFHRVIRDFVIQGGDPQGTGMGGPGYRFEDELPNSGEYQVGSLAMANAGPDTGCRLHRLAQRIASRRGPRRCRGRKTHSVREAIRHEKRARRGNGACLRACRSGITHRTPNPP